jgi:hypothetical protein
VSVAGLEKVILVSRDTGETLACRFNPKELRISKSATWNRQPVRSAPSASTPEFVGTNPQTLSMELFFDGWESPSDVARDTGLLLSWTNPTKGSLDAKQPNPPVIVLHWGSQSYVAAFLKQATVSYTMFREDGTPVRATVSVELEEVPQEVPRQNPTSGGRPGRRMHLLLEGENLTSVAHAEYGDPTLWRAIAEENGIDDPLRVRAGARLLIPPADEVSEVARR